MTFEEFTADVLERVRVDMQSIRSPDGDVHPSLFHYHDGETLRRFKLSRSAFDSGATKDILARSIAEASRLTRPSMIAVSLPAWISMVALDDLSPEEADIYRRGGLPEGTPMPSRDPERREVVVVNALERGGASAGWLSFVTRDERNPPVFGEFDGNVELENVGRMMRPLIEGMR